MTKIFIGTMKDGIKHCGIEFEEGTMTPEKFKIIKHAVGVYIKACDRLREIDNLEEAENEREMLELRKVSVENLK